MTFHHLLLVLTYLRPVNLRFPIIMPLPRGRLQHLHICLSRSFPVKVPCSEKWVAQQQIATRIDDGRRPLCLKSGN
jgi:hypothetical protein